MEAQLTNLLIAETKRRLFDEGMERIKICLAALSEAEVWQRPNENSNSMGNLVLHLAGNVRQWVVAGLGGAADIRERQQEFDERGPIAKAALIKTLEESMALVETTLDRVKPIDLVNVHKVQGFDESGVSILVHVTEHFSYHVGQMTYFVKAIKDMDVGYYKDLDLEVKS